MGRFFYTWYTAAHPSEREINVTDREHPFRSRFNSYKKIIFCGVKKIPLHKNKKLPSKNLSSL
jgi:hypothetical protein